MYCVRTVLDGGSGHLVLGVLVVLGLDLDDDAVALCEAGVAAGLEAIAVGGTSVCGLEGGSLALIVLGADEGSIFCMAGDSVEGVVVDLERRQPIVRPLYMLSRVTRGAGVTTEKGPVRA